MLKRESAVLALVVEPVEENVIELDRVLRARGQAEKVLVLHAAAGVCDSTALGTALDVVVPSSEPLPSSDSGGATRVFFRVSNQVSLPAHAGESAHGP